MPRGERRVCACGGDVRRRLRGGTMIRGTTPTLVFDVDADLTDAQVIYITLRQIGRDAIEKTQEDITVGVRELSVRLTQEETLKLESGLPVEIQIRARFADGSAIASNIMRADAGRILKEGVI